MEIETATTVDTTSPPKKPKLDRNELVAAVSGYWPEVTCYAGGFSPSILDQKENHPCPHGCEGERSFRFQASRDGESRPFCDKCLPSCDNIIDAVGWAAKLDTKKDFRKILQILSDFVGSNSRGNMAGMVGAGVESLPAAAKKKKRPAAPDDVCDRVYRAMLGVLTKTGLREVFPSVNDDQKLSELALSPEHRKNLIDRGFTFKDILKFAFRTLVGNDAVRKAMLKAAQAIPGWEDVPGVETIVSSRMKGMLLPIANLNQQFIRLRVRMDNAPKNKGRYRWFSHDGVDCGSHPHVPLGITAPSPIVRITEGEIKATLAFLRTGVPTLSFPGVSSWKTVLPILDQLQAKTVLLAIDMDASEKPDVAKALRDAFAELNKLSYAVQVERWDASKGKGIDDAIKAGATIEVLEQEAALEFIAETCKKAGVDSIATAPPANSTKLPLATLIDPAPEIAAMLKKSAFDDHRTIVFWQGGYWKWHRGRYISKTKAEIQGEVVRYLNANYSFLTNSITANVMTQLQSQGILDSNIRPPAWLDGDAGDELETWVPRNLLAFPNAIVNLPALVGGQEFYSRSATPKFFTTTALDYPFDLKASEPTTWRTFLEQLWPDDPESIDTLQEWFGYCLTADTSQQKIFMIVGPPRSGKGTVARVLESVIGADNVVNPTLASFGTNFGLWPLVGKSLAVVADARLSGKSDQAAIVERLLSISGEDSLTIDRKNMEPITMPLSTRLMILTNELPRLTDASGAIASRMIPLRIKPTFFGREDTRLSGRLVSERASILLWSIEGWARLQKRGHFVTPATGEELAESMRDLASPVGAFVKEFCVLGDAFSITVDELFERWTSWSKSNNREPGDKPTFGRNLRAAVPRLKTRQSRESDGDRIRNYDGITLRG